MSSNYLPFTHEIRSAAVVGLTLHIHRRALGITVLEAEKIAMHSFDSWIANEKRKARAEAWEECVNEHRFTRGTTIPVNPYKEEA